LVVFPRTAVTIAQSRFKPVVANPNNVMFYEPCQSYRRTVVDPRGDRCEFYAIAPDLLEELLASTSSLTSGSDSRFFKNAWGPSDAKQYLAQRILFSHICSNAEVDPFFVEESALNILVKVFDQSSRHSRNKPASTITSMNNRDQVQAAIEFMSLHHNTAISIEDIAEHLDISVFHLCRIFKKHTGTSMHQYLTQYRLRSAVEKIHETQSSITDVAFDFEFSSHSHFSSAFRQVFGITPKQLRKPEILSLLN